MSASGCGFWRNFSTYFNTLYLARTHLDAYEDQLAVVQPQTNGPVALQNHRWLDEEFVTRELAEREGRSLPVPATFSRTLSATKQVTNVHLDSAIILGSKILANKKETKYVEDALFVVGKAQFYKNDFSGARRKFLELLTRYPDTKYGAEVQVLLARSMLSSHQLDTAQTALATALAIATKDGDRSAVADVHRAYAEYIYARNPDSLAAIAEQMRAAEDGLSGNELSKLAFEEGAVDYYNSDWTSAEAAFRRAYESAKDDWMIGEAHVAHAQALRREGRFDDARKELTMVVSKVKFSGSHPDARYELAYTDELAARAAVGNDLHSSDFRDRYHTELHTEYYSLDTAYHNSSAQIMARARFRQAEMYREMGEYDSASKIAIGLIGTRDFSSAAMNDLVTQRMRSLSRFSIYRNTITRMDSLEHKALTQSHGMAPRSEEVDVRTQALQEVLGTRFRAQYPVPLTAEDSAKLPQVEERIRREHAKHPRLVIGDTARFIDSLHYEKVNAHFQLGRAFETFNEVPSARSEYREALAVPLRPLDTANDAMRAQVVYAWLQLEKKEKNLALSDSLLQDLVQHYGQTAFAEQARKLYGIRDASARGESAYTSAYQTLKERGIDAAKPLFNDVVLGYGHEDVAPRSLYALGVSYEEQGRYDSAVAFYRRVLKEYPYSSYADALRPRLADAGVSPLQTPKRIDPTDIRSDEEKQLEEAARARKLREEQQRKELERRPGLPPLNQQEPSEVKLDAQQPPVVAPGSQQKPLSPQPRNPRQQQTKKH